MGHRVVLSAVAIANRSSGAGGKLRDLDLPFDAVFEPGQIDWSRCLAADLLVMFGGDGTLQHTTTEMLNHLDGSPPGVEITLPALAIVPYGTTNMSARNINRSTRRQHAVASLQTILRLAGAEELNTISRPMLAIQAQDNCHYGYFLGLGAIANAVQDWRAQRGDAAAVNQLRSLTSLIRGLRGTRGSSKVKLNEQDLDVYALLLTTLDELLYGSRPFWGSARLSSAAIRATWIIAGTPGLMALAPAVLRGAPRLEGHYGFGSRAFERVTLTSDGPMILDGEVYDYGGSALEISVEDRVRWISL